MDRISELPECIVHRILSSFNAHAELVRMSVLSNHWFNLTASFPILDFSIDKFTNVSRECFFKYVQYTTSRFCHQNVAAHTLKIVTTILEPAELDVINHCLELVLKKGMQMLVIDVTNLSDSPMPKYRLPSVLLSVSVLKLLRISGCELTSSLKADVVQLKSLIRLDIRNVDIDDEVIKTLITSCPRLQVLEISNCHGFKRFCVYGHQNLQKVFITYSSQVEMIDIEAPNLSTLSLAGCDGSGAPQVNLSSCKKLTTVTYLGHPLPNSNGFTDFLSNFPFTENLVMVTTYKGNNLKLSSDSLRTLVLHSRYDLEDIEFRTPNLSLFIYSCSYRLLCPLIVDILWLGQSTHLKACMHCYLEGCIDDLWFQKFRLFLDKKNGFKVLNLCIHIIYSQVCFYDLSFTYYIVKFFFIIIPSQSCILTAIVLQKFKKLETLKVIELPPYELEHVELQLDTHEELSAHVAFVDAVLWCCRPRSLTLRSSFPQIVFEEQSDIVKFTYEKLLQQEVQGHTNIQIVSPSSSSSFLIPIPREGKAITFIKEEATLS